MFFGCIVGLFTYFCGLQLIGIIISMVISIIISIIIFKYFISKDIFIIKSDTTRFFIIFLAICIVLFGCTIMSIGGFDFEVVVKNPIFLIEIIIVAIGILIGIPKFILFIQNYDPDLFHDKELVYIVGDVFSKMHDTTHFSNNKKIHFENMQFIINKECKVKNLNGENAISLNGLKYPITEKNNETLIYGDIVKISKDNLNNGMIRQNDNIIVEKVPSSKNILAKKFLSSKNIPSKEVSSSENAPSKKVPSSKQQEIKVNVNIINILIIIGIMCLIFSFIILYDNNFYLGGYKTKVIQAGEVQVRYNGYFRNLKDVNVTGKDDILFYRDITVLYNGKRITFKSNGEQVARNLPNPGDVITIYKDKNGNLINYSSSNIQSLILFSSVSFICFLLLFIKIRRYRKKLKELSNS